MAGASQIRAGKAFIEISGDSTEFQKAMTSAQKSLDVFATHVGKVGLTFAGFGTAITAPLALATNEFAVFGDRIDKMSARTGAAAEELTALGYAAEQSGSSLGAVDKAAKGLYASMDGAAKGSKEAVDAFAALGLTARDLAGLPLSKQLSLIADGMSRLASEEQKTVVAGKLLGKSGYELLPMLKAGGAELDKATKRAKELGYVMSQEDAKAAAALSSAFTDVKKSLQGLNNAIGVALAPVATAFAETAASATAFISSIIKGNPELVQFTAAVGGVVAAIGSIGLASAGAAKAITATMGGLKSLSGLFNVSVGGVKIFSTVLGAFSLKLIAVAAALGGVYYGMEKLFQYLERKHVEGISLPAPDVEQVSAFEGEARAARRSGGGIGEIQEDFAGRSQAAHENLEKLVAERAEAQRRLDELNAEAMAGMGIGQEFSEDGLFAEITRVSDALNKYDSAIEKLRQDVANADAMTMKLGSRAGLDEIFKPSKAQAESFNAALDETLKKLDEIDAAQEKRNGDRARGDLLQSDPFAAEAESAERLLRSLVDVEAISREMQSLREAFSLADPEEAGELIARMAELSKSYEDAVKNADIEGEFNKKAIAAADVLRKRLSALQTDITVRGEERDFRADMDAGRWTDAGRKVEIESTELERALEENAAAIAEAFEAFQKGDVEAGGRLEKLLLAAREMMDRRDTLEGRQKDVGSTRDRAEDARLTVLSKLDPNRFLEEIDRLSRDLQGQLRESFEKIASLQASGEDTSGEYLSAAQLLEQLEDLKKYGMDRDDMARSLAGGTYSAEAARRMDSGGGQDMQRQQLDETKQIKRLLDEIRREVRNSGGLG